MLSEKDVRQIASLARIELSSEEARTYSHELGQILEYFRRLAEVDTSSVKEGGFSVGPENVFRSDRAEPCSAETREKIMSLVPESKDGYIKVKNVL